MSTSFAMRIASRFAFGGLAIASLCATAYAQSEIKVLSSRADSASGGDAVIQVRVPLGVSVLQVDVLRNGVEVTGAFVATDLTTLQGLVSGLNVGTNVILVRMRSTGSILTKALVQNWPIYGPIFAGAHQRPWICETQASGLGPPPATGPCVAPTRYDWFYKTTAGTFAPLPSLTPPFPADLAQSTTIDGNTVNYIVRVESGSLTSRFIGSRSSTTRRTRSPIHGRPVARSRAAAGMASSSIIFLAAAGPAFRSGERRNRDQRVGHHLHPRRAAPASASPSRLVRATRWVRAATMSCRPRPSR